MSVVAKKWSKILWEKIYIVFILKLLCNEDAIEQEAIVGIFFLWESTVQYSFSLLLKSFRFSNFFHHGTERKTVEKITTTK
jgi:hypothetical protein